MMYSVLKSIKYASESIPIVALEIPLDSFFCRLSADSSNHVSNQVWLLLLVRARLRLPTEPEPGPDFL